MYAMGDLGKLQERMNKKVVQRTGHVQGNFPPGKARRWRTYWTIGEWIDDDGTEGREIEVSNPAFFSFPIFFLTSSYFYLFFLSDGSWSETLWWRWLQSLSSFSVRRIRVDRLRSLSETLQRSMWVRFRLRTVPETLQ